MKLLDFDDFIKISGQVHNDFDFWCVKMKLLDFQEL